MIAGKGSRVVLLTCGSMREARKIARHVVKNRLAMCVNIVSSPVQSIYQWKGKVETAREILMVLKTSARRLAEVEREVLRLHSYDVPEFIVLRIDAGSRKYLAWLNESGK